MTHLALAVRAERAAAAAWPIGELLNLVYSALACLCRPCIMSHMTNEVTPASPRKRGCFFYGCITLIIAMVVLAAAGVVAFRYFQKKVQEYADTKPMAIEKGDASPAKLNAVQKRIDAFKDAVANENTPQELALT